MSWNDITITDEGSRLLSDIIGGGKLTITRAAIGAGTVAIEDLPSQTDVSEPINAPALLAGKEPTEDGKGTILKIQIRNDGVIETARMRQIAVFAKTDQVDEILLVILQDEIGEEIPAFGEFPQFEINQWITLAISRTNNISVVIDSNVYATTKQLQELADSVNSKSESAQSTATAAQTAVTEIQEQIESGNINASTLGGKTAEDFADAEHTHTTSEITDFPESLPANGGNASTVGGAAVMTTAALGLHLMASGTDEPTSANCPPGCWYGQYE